MGFSGKPQAAVDIGLDPEAKQWVLAGIPLRNPLKPIYTNPVDHGGDDVVEEECSTTTPTGEEARIPTRLTCPAAPRKRKPASKCNYGGVREFFSPPDLETVFIRHVERAN